MAFVVLEAQRYPQHRLDQIRSRNLPYKVRIIDELDQKEWRTQQNLLSPKGKEIERCFLL